MFKTAKTAEESKTALAISLLFLDFAAAIFNEFVDKTYALGNKLPEHVLRAANGGLNCHELQFTVLG